MNINQNDTYTQSDHMKWVDKHNLGISHFGIPPTCLRRGNIHFDIFHMRSAITKRLMTYLRRFILSQTFEIISAFSSQILSTFWSDYHMLIWNTNKIFSSFTGKEIKCFNDNTPFILKFLQEYF